MRDDNRIYSTYESTCKYLVKYCRKIREAALTAKTEEEHQKLDYMLKVLNKVTSETLYLYKEKVSSGILALKLNQYKDFIEQGKPLIEADLKRLYKAYEIYVSGKSEYSKVFEITNIYSSAKDIYQDYIELTPLLMNIDYNFFEKLLEIEDLLKKYETNKEMKKVSDDHRIVGLSCNENYEYSKFLINEYINDPEINNVKFCKKYGIVEGVLDYCADVLNEVDVDLYNKYITKKLNNEKLFKEKTIEQFNRVYEGITYGFYLDEEGNEAIFDELSLLTLLPVENLKNFYIDLKRLGKSLNIDKDVMDVIGKYIVSNGLAQLDVQEDIKSVKEVVSVGDIPISAAERNIVFSYMVTRKIPCNSSNFMICLKKFRDYSLNLVDIDLQEFNEDINCTIIPSNRKRSN